MTQPELAEMLKSQDGQLNAVFACFGSAAQRGQYLEDALIKFLSVYNRLCKTKLSLEDLESLERKFRKTTMGALLKELGQHVKFPEAKFGKLLDNALQKRNFLAHHFFLEREESFKSARGRLGLLKELVGIEEVLRQATLMVGGMRVAFEEGFTQTDGSPGAPHEQKGRVLFSVEVDVPDRKST